VKPKALKLKAPKAFEARRGWGIMGRLLNFLKFKYQQQLGLSNLYTGKIKYNEHIHVDNETR